MTKEGKREYNRQYYQKNKEKIKHNVKEYRNNNIEKCKERDKQYYQQNKEEILEKVKQWRETHKEEIAEKVKQYYQDNKEEILKKNKQYRETHKDKIAEYNKQWREQNKDYYSNTQVGRANNLISGYRTSDKLYNRGECTLTSDWIIDNIFNSKCIYCGESDWKLLGCDRIDNSLPHTEDNVVCCCAKCNRKKYTKEFEQYVNEC